MAIKKAAKKSVKKTGAKKAVKKAAKTVAKKVAKKAVKKGSRTTLRSSTGTKLYAVRSAGGKFKDIQTYKRAHGQDVKRKTKAEKPAAANASVTNPAS